MEYNELTELVTTHRKQAVDDTKRRIRWEICEELLSIQYLIDICKDDALSKKLQRRVNRIRKILKT